MAPVKRTSKNKAPAKIAVYTFRIDRDKLDRFREIAEAEHRTVQGELRQMVDERIARHDAPDERAAA